MHQSFSQYNLNLLHNLLFIYSSNWLIYLLFYNLSKLKGLFSNFKKLYVFFFFLFNYFLKFYLSLSFSCLYSLYIFRNLLFFSSSSSFFFFILFFLFFFSSCLSLLFYNILSFN